LEAQDKLIGSLRLSIAKLKQDINLANAELLKVGKIGSRDLLNLKLSLKVDNELKPLLDGLEKVKKTSKETGDVVGTHFNTAFAKTLKDTDKLNANLEVTAKKIQGINAEGKKMSLSTDAAGNIKSGTRINYDDTTKQDKLYNNIFLTLKNIYGIKERLITSSTEETKALQSQLRLEEMRFSKMNQRKVNTNLIDQQKEIELLKLQGDLQQKLRVKESKTIDNTKLLEQNSLYAKQEQLMKDIHQTELKIIKSKGIETDALLKLKALDQQRLSVVKSDISSKNLVNQQKETALKAQEVRYQAELNVAMNKQAELMTKNENLTGGKTFMGKLFNSAAYLASAYILNAIRVTIKDLITYTTELNKAMNEIQIVTGKSASEVNNLAQSYNRLGKEMSVTTREIASVAADMYRQGLGDNQVEERMKAIIQYAKISSISLEESNRIITATANATGESVTKIIDIFALLGDTTSSGAEEIGEALQKVASAAENSGISLEKSASWIATISSITRESASTIGRSLNFEALAA
jgi:hypothetical protein